MGARPSRGMGSSGLIGLRGRGIGRQAIALKLARFMIALAMATTTLPELSAAWADILRAPGEGTIRALVIGVDVYPNLAPSAQLHGARADAADIAGALRRGGVEPVVILNADATRAKIVAQMDSLVAESKPGDLVLFAFAGHGMQVPEYPHWKGIDRDGVNEQIVLSGFSFSGAGAGEIIVNLEMRAWLSRLDAKLVDTLVVMDSCFGGGMRTVDPRTGEMRTRVVHGSAEQIKAGESDRRRFVGIPMTAKEARADVALMPHVTFLAGATSKSVVPETGGLEADRSRGALSFYLARALDEGLSKDRVITRQALYDYLKRNVRNATQDRQLIQVEPQSPDPSVYSKPVMTFAGALSPASPSTQAPVIAPSSTVAAGPPSPPTGPPSAPTDVQTNAVRVALIDGPDKAWETIENGNRPFIRSPTIDGADLVWDIDKSEALSRGDLVMQSVDGSLIGGIVDRTWAVERLRDIAEHQSLPMQLASDGRLLTPGDQARIEIDDIADARLVVFNIGADATVQMLYPSPPDQAGHCPDPEAGNWRCSLAVTPPFGADTIVALTTSGTSNDVLGWLRAHHGRRDGALVPELLRSAIKTDLTIRVGFAGVFTNAGQQP
jgi:Caspase domain